MITIADDFALHATRQIDIAMNTSRGSWMTGATRDEILADYPYLEAEDVAAVLEFAARQNDHPVRRSA